MSKPEGPVEKAKAQSAEAWDLEALHKRLKELQHGAGEHKELLLVIGAAALAIGGGVYAYKNRKYFIGFADRRAEKKGIISIGELEHGGSAASAPISPEAQENAADKDIFAMGPEGFAYPSSENPEDVAKHSRVLRSFAGFLSDRLLPHADAGDDA